MASTEVEFKTVLRHHPLRDYEPALDFTALQAALAFGPDAADVLQAVRARGEQVRRIFPPLVLGYDRDGLDVLEARREFEVADAQRAELASRLVVMAGEGSGRQPPRRLMTPERRRAAFLAAAGLAVNEAFAAVATRRDPDLPETDGSALPLLVNFASTFERSERDPLGNEIVAALLDGAGPWREAELTDAKTRWNYLERVERLRSLALQNEAVSRRRPRAFERLLVRVIEEVEVLLRWEEGDFTERAWHQPVRRKLAERLADALDAPEKKVPVELRPRAAVALAVV